jgi:hypothetical protein
MNLGFDKPLYILPFDHRGSFQKKMFGWEGVLTKAQTAEIAAAKRVIYDGFEAAVASLYMFELLVPAEKTQLDAVNGDKKAYDLKLRPSLMVQAIQQLQDNGVEPDLWKIEGLDRSEDCEKVVNAAKRNGRDKVSCIILGRGEDDEKVHEWLETAARVPGFVGFAVGRTVFWEPLVALLAKKSTREAAVTEIARRYSEFVHVFDKARSK